MRRLILIALMCMPLLVVAQINTDRVMMIGRNALYFEDYVLSIQYFNQVINAKPYLHEPYFYRGLAKLNLDDFNGAEQDCSEAIGKNPFVVNYYQVRGLARIKQGNFQGAIDDYNQALVYAPENVGVWHNLILCKMKQEKYDEAEAGIKQLLTFSPRYVPAFLMHTEVALKQKDTLQAEQCVGQALELDKYDDGVWATRAMLRLQQERYEEAESDLNQALHLAPKSAGYHINRALARYHQNNLRGAMGDYDRALDIEPANLIGHYNRGLLRAQVGDDNRAIEDFDCVIMAEPDNMMAIFNRGLLRDQTGDYRGAVEDYSAVIEEYPNFLYGYQQRAVARRKIGDRKGAEADEAFLLKAEIDRRNRLALGRQTNDEADREEEQADKKKTRKRSERDVKNYGKIVVADNDEGTQKYKNDYRGRVQDRNVNVELEPMFVLTYYKKESEVKRTIVFNKLVEELNQKETLPHRILLTNQETPLNQEQVQEHFASVDELSSAIVSRPNDAYIRFARALDFYLVQDLDNSLEDLTKAILYDDQFMPAYFNRALVRCKQLEYERVTAIAAGTVEGEGDVRIGVNSGKTMDFELIKYDLNKVIELAPDFECAYYNRGNLFCQQNDYHAAMVDFNKAIALNPSFAEAYYNRGLTQIFLGNLKEGLSDLSKAGELGIYSVYSIIKRYTESKE